MECSGNKNYSKAIIIIFIIAALYTVLPDLVPGPVDDAAVDGVAGIIIIILKSIEAGSKSVARDFVINNRDELKDAVKCKLKNEQAKEQLDNCSDFINHAYDAKSSENIDQIQNNLNEAIQKEKNRVAKTIDNIYIIKHVEIPTTIVECGFLSNPEEEQKLLNDEYQNRLSWGIYNGIIDYFYDENSQK